MKKGQYIGIDFGTTNTSVVFIEDDEYGRNITPLGDEEGFPFSSIVAIPKDGGKLLFRREVRKNVLRLQKHMKYIHQ